MKKIVKFMGVCLMAFAVVSMVSCGSKVNKDDLDKKIEKAMKSDSEPEFTQAEYQFMADYLLDNFDKLEKVDYDSKEAETAMTYMIILASADYQGLLDKETKKKWNKLNEKVKDTKEYKDYKDTEKAIMDALEEADMNWEDASEEVEAEDDYEVVVEE